MDELYQQIIDSYKETGSVKKTAEELGTYPIKVRRVLITEGLWHSKTSDQIAELLEQGLSVAEIAEELVISEKNVQSYMPYTRGQYGGNDRSSEALRSEVYRERMQAAEKNQVKNTEAKSGTVDKEVAEQRRILEELRAEKERLLDEHRKVWAEIEDRMRREPVALQLHLELDMEYADDNDLEVLRKYGRMKKSISRDFIVPGNMTLHGLNYAILKAFGWQNGHLHNYSPYAEEFDKMTDGSLVKEWTRQVGMYFRFPSDDFADIYWDDDYEEGQSFKSWLKSKYCGPYAYGGTGEYYVVAQKEVERFRKKYPKIQTLTTDQRTWDVYVDGACEELLERLRICDVLKTPDNDISWDFWRNKKEEYLSKVEIHRKDALDKYEHLAAKLEKLIDEAREEAGDSTVMSDKLEMLFEQMDEISMEIDDLMYDTTPEVIPALTALRYQYDYGDGWEVKITCTNAWYDKSIYKRDEDGFLLHDRHGFLTDKTVYLDSFGQAVEENLLVKLKDIYTKEKPLGIAWDGINLIDDVGGISGFCEFLNAINGDDPVQKKEYKEWSRIFGWTGRMPKPENML